MRIYRRILVAVDLGSDSLRIARRAHDLSLALGAELRMLHVVTPMLISTPMPPEPAAPDVLGGMVEVNQQAQLQMSSLARAVGLHAEHWMILEGSIKDEILRAAHDLDADLIVLGGHERHGLAVLTGGTEAAVSRRAACDVLEVRLPR